MNMKKVLAGTITAAMLLTATAPSLIAATDTNTDLTAIPVTEAEKMAHYAAVSGTITAIDEYESNGETYQLISIQGTDGPSTLSVSKDTILTEGLTLAVGAKVVGFYEAGLPMIMIYPPQYRVVAIAAEQDGFVHADIYNDELISQDGQLKLNIGDDTKVVDQNGAAYAGSLANEHLLVYYTVSTRSIPAQATPSKVVVLNVTAETEEEEEIATGDGSIINSSLDIIVEGNPIKTPGAYVNEEGVVMVPLREVVKALGHTYKWNSEQRRGLIDSGRLFVSPGKDVYSNTREAGAVTSLGTAPEMKGIRLYVPLKFFTDIMGVNNAYVLEGQVVIDNGELMK